MLVSNLCSHDMLRGWDMPQPAGVARGGRNFNYVGVRLARANAQQQAAQEASGEEKRGGDLKCGVHDVAI